MLRVWKIMLDSGAELVFVMPRLKNFRQPKRGGEIIPPPLGSLVGTIYSAIIVSFSTSIR
jgi:hypothetical protein